MNRRKRIHTTQLELKELFDKGIIVKGRNTRDRKISVVGWDKFEISVSGFLEDPKDLRINLKYRVEQESPLIDIDIQLMIRQANFKHCNSYIFSFICPINNKSAKILYLCSKTHLFVCDQAYNDISVYQPKIEMEFPVKSNQEILEYKRQTNAAYDKRNDELNKIYQFSLQRHMFNK